MLVVPAEEVTACVIGLVVPAALVGAVVAVAAQGLVVFAL